MMSTGLVVLNAVEARALTDRIKVGVEAVWHLITQAYTERAWDVLGYSSWDDYCTREFGSSRLRLPREERAEVVASLRESGLSLRAIASATGISHTEARRSLDAGVTNVPAADAETAGEPVDLIDFPEPDLPPLPENYMQPKSTPAQMPEPEPTPITGLDGKAYNPKPAASQRERRTSIIDTARNVGLDLAKITTRIENLSSDDRLAKNKAEISARLQHQLGLAIQACQGLNQHLSPGA